MKTDAEKIIEVLVNKDVYPNKETAMLRDGAYWLEFVNWNPNRGWWHGPKDGNGHKIQGCWSGDAYKGYYLAWREVVIKQPRKPHPGKFSRTKFAAFSTIKEAKAATRNRRT